MDIGIDLGTTCGVIAVKGKAETAPGYPSGQYLEEMDVTILPSVNGNLTFPSVLWWHPDDPERYVFGDEAKQMVAEGKAPIMFSKRSIGTTNKLMLNGRTFTAKEVATLFLRHLKEWAETVTGQKVDRAVVTHPAYFTPNQREETLKAAQGAGLNVTPEQLIMEPCAAALAYTLNDTRDPLRLMVYDLGGGTFDVAVMEKIDGVIQMRKFDGDHLLGGYNFDTALVQWVLDQLKAEGRAIPYDESNEEHQGRRARMLQVAETVKLRLSEQRSDKVPVPVQVDFLVDNHGQAVQFRGQINREQYAALIQEPLQETIQCCRRALDRAGMKAEDLNSILLVGGSTKGKWVVDAVAGAFGTVSEPYFPDLCVAAGAAQFVNQLPLASTQNERIELSLDYPSRSVLPAVNIAGIIRPSRASALGTEACRRLQVHLRTPEGNLVGPADIGTEGRFVFRDVALLEDGSRSSFQVSVSENGKQVLSQEGSIAYVERTPPAAACVVLPRPLFIKTERMVAIMEEGVPLPARCQVQLRRSFSGPSVDIPIFLENEQVGTICVEDIPDEAGEGCLVVVDVEVTHSNEMRGNVLVYGPDGKTVFKEQPIRVAFPPLAIPKAAELLGKFDELKDRLEMEMLQASPQDRARLAGPGRTLVRKIQKISEEQVPDNQVLYERIRELERIVNQPPDDMDPPRREFENLLEECHESLAAAPENSTLKAYSSQLDRVETAGKDAYDTKNYKKWANANEALLKLRASIERNLSPPSCAAAPSIPPPFVLKAHASRMIEELRASLKIARESRMREHGAERWMAQFEECEHRIDQMASGIAEVSDNTPGEQALAQIQSCLSTYDTIRKKIQTIAKGTQLFADSDPAVRSEGGALESPSPTVHCERAQRLNEIAGFLERAKGAMESGEFSDALPPLNEASKRAPDNSAVYLLRCQAHIALGDLTEARKDARTFAELAGSKEEHDAEKQLNEIIAQAETGTAIKGLLDQATQAMKSDRIKDALPLLDEAARKAPRHDVIYFLRAQAHAALGNCVEAREDAEMVAKLAETDDDREHAQRLKETIAQVELQRRAVEAFNSMDFAAASELLRSALEHCPAVGREEATKELAAVLTTWAVTAVNRALERGSTPAQELRTICLESLGRLQEASRLAPDDGRVRENLNTLQQIISQSDEVLKLARKGPKEREQVKGSTRSESILSPESSRGWFGRLFDSLGAKKPRVSTEAESGPSQGASEAPKPGNRTPEVPGGTPLQAAAAQGHKEAAELLLDTNTKAAAKDRGTPEVPGGRIDDVHFSVTSPRCVHPGYSFMLDVWAHLKRQRQAVIKQAREAIAGGEIVIQSKGPIQVARGTVLSVLLKIDGMSVKDPQDTIYWKGEIGNARFPVMVPDDAKEGSRAGLATIYLDGVQIAKIHFSLMVGKEASAENDVPFQVKRHRKAFASYASQDRNDVLTSIQGMEKADPGLDVFYDEANLRSGASWEQELKRVIPESDVFYLFWSASAKVSRWVDMEWRWALDRRGIEFIDPVPLVSPEEVPPPEELGGKHFKDWVLAYRRRRP